MEDEQVEVEATELTEKEKLAEKRKRHDETFKRAKEFLRKYFENVAREQKGMKQ